MSELKLTPPRHEAIVEALRKGRPVSTACAAAGVSRSQFYAWLTMGEKEGSPQVYRRFFEDASKARADFEGGRLDLIDEVGEASAYKEVRCPNCDTKHMVEVDSAAKIKALIWRLETLRPDEYGRRAKVEIKVAQSQLQELIGAMAQHLTPNEHVRFLEVAAIVVAGPNVAPAAIASGEGTDVIDT